MNIDNIKELTYILKKANYKDVFAALVAYETMDDIMEIDNIIPQDITELEKLYDKYLRSDINLINVDGLEELTKEED